MGNTTCEVHADMCFWPLPPRYGMQIKSVISEPPISGADPLIQTDFSWLERPIGDSRVWGGKRIPPMDLSRPFISMKISDLVSPGLRDILDEQWLIMFIQKDSLLLMPYSQYQAMNPFDDDPLNCFFDDQKRAYVGSVQKCVRHRDEIGISPKKLSMRDQSGTKTLLEVLSHEPSLAIGLGGRIEVWPLTKFEGEVTRHEASCTTIVERFLGPGTLQKIAERPLSHQPFLSTGTSAYMRVFTGEAPRTVLSDIEQQGLELFLRELPQWEISAPIFYAYLLKVQGEPPGAVVSFNPRQTFPLPDRTCSYEKIKDVTPLSFSDREILCGMKLPLVIEAEPEKKRILLREGPHGTFHGHFIPTSVMQDVFGAGRHGFERLKASRSGNDVRIDHY